MNSYPGAKANSGIQQFLINNIPYHDRYFELFLGSGALFFSKKRAARSELSDINMDCVRDVQSRVPQREVFRTVSLGGIDAITVLKDERGIKTKFTRNDFIYLDPPYPFECRRSQRPLYKHEMTDQDHIDLINVIRSVDANIMISTRHNEIYSTMLSDWRMKEFKTVDHGGAAVEVIYMNYEEPALLHQYDHLGEDYIKRQGVKRKIQRFTDKIQELPPYEKHLFIQQIINNDTAAVQHFLTVHAGK